MSHSVATCNYETEERYYDILPFYICVCINLSRSYHVSELMYVLLFFHLWFWISICNAQFVQSDDLYFSLLPCNCGQKRLKHTLKINNIHFALSNSNCLFIKAYLLDLEFPERKNVLRGVLWLLAVGYLAFQKWWIIFATKQIGQLDKHVDINVGIIWVKEY